MRQIGKEVNDRTGANGIHSPDYFIVGAPKCGTSSLASYLKQHPRVYLPESKDVPFFGSDLQYRPRRETLDEYQNRFAGAGGATRIGEACTAYLYSRRAAAEINAYSTDADIIVMLRNPLETMYS
ncbi:MAG: sulfotransferase, partial [Chloroflexota bacterium]